MKTRILSLLVLALAASGESDARRIDPGLQAADQSRAPLKGLKIHEWGVFLVGKASTRASAGGEAPTFVQRVQMPEKPAAGEEPPCADKPVLHIYAPKLIDLEVHVSFPGGTPKLAWPRGTPEWLAHRNMDKAVRRGLPPEPDPGLCWTLKVGGESEAQPPKVPEGHWIAACRKPGSDLVRAGQDAERFLFYEGEVAQLSPELTATPTFAGMYPPGYLFTSKGPAEAWVVDGAQTAHVKGMEKDKPLHDTLVSLDPKAIRTQFETALKDAGLSDKEAAAVLDIWVPELTKPGKRLVYLLPRAEYDRLLPITFDPAPEELKRVGLVVQEIQP